MSDNKKTGFIFDESVRLKSLAIKHQITVYGTIVITKSVSCRKGKKDGILQPGTLLHVDNIISQENEHFLIIAFETGICDDMQYRVTVHQSKENTIKIDFCDDNADCFQNADELALKMREYNHDLDKIYSVYERTESKYSSINAVTTILLDIAWFLIGMAILHFKIEPKGNQDAEIAFALFAIIAPVAFMTVYFICCLSLDISGFHTHFLEKPKREMLEKQRVIAEKRDKILSDFVTDIIERSKADV